MQAASVIEGVVRRGIEWISTAVCQDSGAPPSLFDLPPDMLRLIVAELQPRDAARFAQVSRGARALVDIRYLNVEYGRCLYRELSPGAEPPNALPDLFQDAHWLGYAVWYREADGSDSGHKAARLLRWVAVYEPRGDEIARRKVPQWPVLALAAPRPERTIGGLVAGCPPGEELARIYQVFAEKCQRFVEGRSKYREEVVQLHREMMLQDRKNSERIYRALQVKLQQDLDWENGKASWLYTPLHTDALELNEMTCRLEESAWAVFRSGASTAEQLGMVYCAWLHSRRLHRESLGQGEVSYDLPLYLECDAPQWEIWRSAQREGLIHYRFSMPPIRAGGTSPRARYITVSAPLR